ncbi:MAG: hypothetical protein COC06_05795 [Bacteroidales bacterium]|nr:MAG: hypothetical protein COC06_05795 [Bacteroidales bacterium]
MKLKHIEILMKNPYNGSEILTHFASGYNTQGIPLELFYLVLPIMLNKQTRDIFASVNKSNNLSNIIKENLFISANFQNKIRSLKDLTNLSLIVAHNNKQLNVTNMVSTIDYLDYNKSPINKKDSHRAAYYLGFILSKEKSHIQVFKKFKVLPK